MSTTSNTRPEEKQESQPKTLGEALQLLREDAKAAGTDQMTMEEIIEEIAAYRREKREQEKAGQ